jgi:hypothetical protein
MNTESCCLDVDIRVAAVTPREKWADGGRRRVID